MPFKQIAGCAAALLMSFGVMGNALADQAPPSEPAERYIIKFEGPSLAAAFGNRIGSRERGSEGGRSGKLNVRSRESVDFLADLRQTQDQYLAEIASATGRSNLQVLSRYDVVLNGVAVELTESQADAIRDLAFVEFVEKEQHYPLNTYGGPEWLNADQIWDGSASPTATPSRGEGVIIGVVDSGINLDDHPSFVETDADGFTHTNPLGSGNYLGDCIGGTSGNDLVECNSKLIGAWTFLGGTPDDNEACVGHGSHTASTAGGNRVLGPFPDVFQGGTSFVDVPAPSLSGVAPRANLVAYRACEQVGDACSCPGTALLDGLQQAAIDGVDVVNYSIGPGNGGRGQNPWVNSSERTMLDLVNVGIFVSASAGNTAPPPNGNNPNPEADVANKGPWVMTVANSTHGVVLKNEVSLTGPGSPPASTVDVYGRIGSGPEFTGPVNAGIEHSGNVDPANIEGCDAWGGTPFQGEVALIQRGACNFSVKVDNADAAGAIAVVIYNDAGDVPIVMGALETTNIPSVMIGQTFGQDMASFIASNPTAEVFIDDETVKDELDEVGNVLSGGSLVGPNLDFDFTKPDINGPGTLIVAATAVDTPAPALFRFLSGTSMSSPHVAGSAALVISQRPDWTVMEVKSAIMMTADPAGTNAAETGPTNADEVGSGTVDLAHAALAGLVMNETYSNMLAARYDTGGNPETLNFPSMRSTTCDPGCSWTRTVRGTLEGGSSWTVSASGDGFDVEVIPDNFELLGGDVILRGGFESDGEPTSSYQTLEINVTNNTAGDQMRFGEILLEEDTEQAPDARMTIAVSETLPPTPPI